MRFYITNIIKVFYLLDFMRAMLYNPRCDFLKSVEKLRDDINKVYFSYAKHLADTLYDYIIYSTLYELCNATTKCDISLKEVLGFSIWDIQSLMRKDHLKRLYIPAYLDVAEHIYFKGDWEYCYGGIQWGKAIRYAKLRPKVSDILFIDSIIDLQHNTGSLFSKGNPFFKPCSGDILEYLDRKTCITKDSELFSYLEIHAADFLNKEIRSLLFRFIQVYSGRYWREEHIGYFYSFSEHINFFINSRVCDECSKEIDLLMKYEPVKYSTTPTLYKICNSVDLQIEKYGYSFSDEDDDEREDREISTENKEAV